MRRTNKIVVVLAFLLGTLGSPYITAAAQAATPVVAGGGRVAPACTFTPAACRVIAWQKKARAHEHLMLVRQYRHTAIRALRLAAAYSGLPLPNLKCIGWNESRMGAQTTPEPSSGASGLMQFLRSTWAHTPFAAYGFSVWDEEANALAAVQIMVHDGSARQWSTGAECGL